MLRVDSISAYYGDFNALENVTLELPSSGVVALIGPNAAGKTTTLRAISGQITVRAGTITYNDEVISGLQPREIVERGIAHVPEGRKIFTTLTVEENLLIGGYSQRARRTAHRRKDNMYDLFPKLAERRRQLAGSLSGGEQQMCAIARGLMGDPSLLMVDEMSLGLAPIIVQEMFTLMVRVSEDVCVLLVEQQVQQVLKAASFAYVIEKGRTVLSGSAKELQNSAYVREAYLGV